MSSSAVTPDSTCQFRNYRLYGVSLRSEIPLGFPEQPAGDFADVTMFFAPRQWFAEATAGLSLDERTDDWYRYALGTDGAEFILWPHLFEFMVSNDGRFIACGLLEQATLASFQTYLLGHVLSFALVKQGYEPLHATAVVVDGKAVAFLGTSGAGKSTLAAAFLQAGHEILTDDLLLLSEIHGSWCGFPGAPRIKLFPEVAQRFLPRQAACTPMNPDTEKLIISLEPHQLHSGATPLHGFFMLGEPEPQVSGVGSALLLGTRPLLELVRSTFNTRVTTHDRLRRQFLAVAEWAARIPVRRLAYPRALAMIEQVRQTIIYDVRSASSPSS